MFEGPLLEREAYIIFRRWSCALYNLVPRASPLKVGGAPSTFKGEALGTRLGVIVLAQDQGYQFFIND